MRRVIATVLVTLMAFATSFEAVAIEGPYQKSTMLAGAHFGILPGYGSTVYGDYVVADSWWKGHFTVGGQIGITRQAADYFVIFPSKTDTKWSTVALTARATYGLNLSKSFEVHAGALLGVGFRSQKGYKLIPGFAYGGLLGLRWFFTDNLALSFELQHSAGYGPLANVGLAFKF